MIWKPYIEEVDTIIMPSKTCLEYTGSTNTTKYSTREAFPRKYTAFGWEHQANTLVAGTHDHSSTHTECGTQYWPAVTLVFTN